MNLPTAYGTKTDGQVFEVHNPDLFRLSLNQLPEGRYKITVKKCYNKASKEQFAYLYGLVYPMMFAAILETGETAFKSIEDLDMWCKFKWASKEQIDIDTGMIITLPMSKSEFKTIDEMTYCNLLRDYCREHFDLEIPNPEKNWKTNK